MKGERLASDLSDICVPREIPISRLQASRGCGLLVVLAFLLRASTLTLTPLVLHFRTLFLKLEMTKSIQETSSWKPYIHWASCDIWCVHKESVEANVWTYDERISKMCRQLHTKRHAWFWVLVKYYKMIKYRRLRWTELVLRVGGTQNLVGRSEGNRRLGRPSRRRGDDIKVDIEERGWGVVGCGLHSCAFVNTVMTTGVQQSAENFSYVYGCFSKGSQLPCIICWESQSRKFKNFWKFEVLFRLSKIPVLEVTVILPVQH